MSDKTLRIAMLIDCYGGSFIGGGQVHVQNLRHYLEKNHNCEIAIFSQKSEHIARRFLFSLQVLPMLVIAHINKPFDCVHSQTQSLGLSAKILSFILDIPCIQSIHGSHLMDQKDQTLKGRLEKLFLTQIPYDLEITDSQSFLKYQNVNRTIVYIPNGAKIQKKRLINKKISKIIHLLFIGRLEKVKGLDILLQALAKIKNNNWYLDVVGDGSLKSEIVQLHKDLSLEKHISFHGSKKNEELANFYRNADIFILPSLAEGQPVSLLEAWSYGLPVIVSQVGDNPYMVIDKKNGLLIKPGDVKGLVKIFEWCFENRDKLPAMGKAGNKNIVNIYNWQNIAAKYYQEYKRLCKS